MPQDAVVFDHVWKKFKLGETHTSLRDLVPALAKRLVSKPKDQELTNQEFWALKDVSFAVKRGEALGILGPNGAGKSTTLKLLTRILRPTLGKSSIRGRVGALIEVAAGFHPDLTGRENIFLQGAVMGMKRAYIADKLDDIIEFSGLQKFIETPVKRYSSGMNARLGFSIAANLNPEVLIIDEVLAVGDMAFQQRCIERMEQFRQGGVAIVFVSHNLQAISSLCQRAILLAGSIVADGPPDDVIKSYVAMSTAQAKHAADNDAVRITGSDLVDESGKAVSSMLPPGTDLQLFASYLPKADASDVTFEFLVYRSTDNFLAYSGHFSNRDLGLTTLVSGRPFDVAYAFKANLTRGHYHVVTRIWDNQRQQFLAQVSPPAIFVVDELQTWGGLAHLEAKAELRAVAAAV